MAELADFLIHQTQKLSRGAEMYKSGGSKPQELQPVGPQCSPYLITGFQKFRAEVTFRLFPVILFQCGIGCKTV